MWIVGKAQFRGCSTHVPNPPIGFSLSMGSTLERQMIQTTLFVVCGLLIRPSSDVAPLMCRTHLTGFSLSMGSTLQRQLIQMTRSSTALKVTVDLRGVFWGPKQYSALCINGKYINLYTIGELI